MNAAAAGNTTGAETVEGGPGIRSADAPSVPIALGVSAGLCTGGSERLGTGGSEGLEEGGSEGLGTGGGISGRLGNGGPVGESGALVVSDEAGFGGAGGGTAQAPLSADIALGDGVGGALEDAFNGVLQLPQIPCPAGDTVLHAGQTVTWVRMVTSDAHPEHKSMPFAIGLPHTAHAFVRLSFILFDLMNLPAQREPMESYLAAR